MAFAALGGCGSSRDPVGNLIAADDPLVAAAERRRFTTGATASRSLTAAPTTIDLAARTIETWAFDGVVPGPLLRANVGDMIEVTLANGLAEDTTIHWHGLALRNDMDGVHGLTQDPIAPGSRSTYRFVAHSIA